MTQEAGAGSGNPDGSGSGAPEGGSPEGGSENDDKPITARQLKAALASQRVSFEEKLSAKDRELQAFKEGVGKRDKPDEPKVYTKPQLKSAVESGQISQEQADDIWDTQREAQIRESAVADARNAVSAERTQERIDSDLKSYKRLKPEILDTTSETRQDIETEFKALRASGLPNDLRTELAAIRAVLGPLAKLEKAASASRSQESHEETGGGGGGEQRPKGGSGKKLVDHLKGDAKEYYERGIKQGRYKDWDAVEAELKYARTSVRQRLGLPTA